MIGATTFPFAMHEIGRTLRSNHTKRGSFGVKVGVGYTYANCTSAKTRAGITLGLSRLYQIGKHTGVRAEVIYATRKFSQSTYSEAYPKPDPRRFRHTRVDFSVGYIETALLFEVRLLRSRRASLLFVLGPSNSVVVYDQSHFEITDTPNAPTSSQECYLAHQYDEPSESWFYSSLNLGLTTESHHVMLGIGFKRALYGSQQIARLDDHSRFNSLEVTAGYKF
ncbi:MAG: outer membrane beta-barrel protein [candidate division KSB1 bacterium]